jgi:hypothetical protein
MGVLDLDWFGFDFGGIALVFWSLRNEWGWS